MAQSKHFRLKGEEQGSKEKQGQSRQTQYGTSDLSLGLAVVFACRFPPKNAPCSWYFKHPAVYIAALPWDSAFQESAFRLFPAGTLLHGPWLQAFLKHLGTSKPP